MRGKIGRWLAVVVVVSGVFFGVLSPSIAHAAPGDPTKDIAASDQDVDAPNLDCNLFTKSLLAWIGCPVVIMLRESATGLNSAIDSMMTIKISAPDGTGLFSKNFKLGWSSFRVIGIGLVVVFGLVMLSAQALGFELLDAYTVRKVLPRLVVAIIMISLSWEILKLLVEISNVTGNSVRAIIYAPFKEAKDLGGFQTALQYGNWTGVVITLLAGVGAITLGLAAMLTFVATAALAVAIGFLILLARQLVIMMLVLTAPLAIAFYVLPNTQKVFDFWKGTLFSMLVVFPIISGFIATGRIFAILAYSNDNSTGGVTIINQLTAFAAFFLPYFALPFAFRLAGGAIATIAGIVNDRGRGAFDRMKGFRQQQMSSRFQDARSGKGGYMGARPLGAVYRRTTMPGGLTGALPGRMGARSRDKYNAAVKQMYRTNADESIKNDNNFAAGNDDANTLAAKRNMSRGKFVREYSLGQLAANKKAIDEGKLTEKDRLSEDGAKRMARDALAEIETGYGAQMGSGAMRVAAFKARAASNKGYDFGSAQKNYRAAFGDAGSLVNDHLMNVSDAAAIIKSNGARSDFSGIGFGATMTQVSKTATRLSNKKNTTALVTDDEVAVLANDVLTGSNPGAIMGGRHESVTALAPYMLENINSAIDKSAKSGNPDVALDQLANIAGLYDEFGRTSPIKAEKMSKEVLSQHVKDTFIGREDPKNPGVITGINDMVTVREMLERARDMRPGTFGHQSFLERRREYGNRWAAEQSQNPTEQE